MLTVRSPREPGVFDYTVQTVPDDRNIVFDDTVYSIKIYVTECVNTLEANMIATKSEEKYSGSKLIFVNSEESSDEPTSNPQDSPTESSNNDRNPKTSDDTRMEMYFLFAMIASVGLLTLSHKTQYLPHCCAYPPFSRLFYAPQSVISTKR